ncbi:hypothetical protein Bpfe_008308, partial [Biomphalaria pfeifferi]
SRFSSLHFSPFSQLRVGNDFWATLAERRSSGSRVMFIMRHLSRLPSTTSGSGLPSFSISQ